MTKRYSNDCCRSYSLRMLVVLSLIFVLITSFVIPIIQLDVLPYVKAKVNRIHNDNEQHSGSPYANVPFDLSLSFSPSGTIGSQELQDQQFTTQAALSSPAARQINNIVNTKAYYDIVFTTTTTGPIKRIDMTFPASTDLSQVRLLEREGIGAGRPGVTGNTLTPGEGATLHYVVINLPAHIA